VISRENIVRRPKYGRLKDGRENERDGEEQDGWEK